MTQRLGKVLLGLFYLLYPPPCSHSGWAQLCAIVGFSPGKNYAASGERPTNRRDHGV